MDELKRGARWGDRAAGKLAPEFELMLEDSLQQLGSARSFPVGMPAASVHALNTNALLRPLMAWASWGVMTPTWTESKFLSVEGLDCLRR
jgi:hypothetical protein